MKALLERMDGSIDFVRRELMGSPPFPRKIVQHTGTVISAFAMYSALDDPHGDRYVSLHGRGKAIMVYLPELEKIAPWNLSMMLQQVRTCFGTDILKIPTRMMVPEELTAALLCTSMHSALIATELGGITALPLPHNCSNSRKQLMHHFIAESRRMPSPEFYGVPSYLIALLRQLPHSMTISDYVYSYALGGSVYYAMSGFIQHSGQSVCDIVSNAIDKAIELEYIVCPGKKAWGLYAAIEIRSLNAQASSHALTLQMTSGGELSSFTPAQIMEEILFYWEKSSLQQLLTEQADEPVRQL